jgi:hypothetical protein
MQVGLVTTGLAPLCIGSVETFVHLGYLNGLAWNLTGGSASLLMTDSQGNQYTYPSTIGADGVARVVWTVAAPAGQWVRAWKATDSTGLTQVSKSITFVVASSPS